MVTRIPNFQQKKNKEKKQQRIQSALQTATFQTLVPPLPAPKCLQLTMGLD
jgi:hypothetical protein